MKNNDAQLGQPETLYKGTKASIEALTGVVQGSIAYATDTDELGTYSGTVWTWGVGSGSSTSTDAHGGHSHGVTRLTVVSGATTFDLWDVAKQVLDVSLNGFALDPMDYSLGSDGTQLVLGTAISVDGTLIVGYIIDQRGEA